MSTTRTAPKTLLLSWTIPPTTTGSAIIAGNIARQFTREQMVLAGEAPAGSPPDVAWSDRHPSRHWVSHATAVRGARWWRRLQVPAMLARTVRLIRRERCDSLVTVFPNEEFLLVGYLAARMARVRFFPWLHNTYVENRTGGGRAFAEWLQKRVFAAASQVFVANDGMADLYRREYPDLNCVRLPPNFEEPLPEPVAPPEPGAELRFAFCGNINASCAEAMRRMCEVILSLPDTSITVFSGDGRRQLNAIGISSDRVNVDAVSRDRLVPRLAESDVMLLPHGLTGSLSAEEYETIFPTKTIEYLISGRPILAHAPANTYISRFLREHDCALLINEPDPAALAEAVGRLRADAPLRAGLVKNAVGAAAQFQSKSVASVLQAALAA